MAAHREGVNPLRPYYIPPTIGPPAEALNKSSPNPNPLSQGGHATASGRYATKARDMFSDLEYKEYLGDPSPSVVQNVKDLIDELIWKYTSVLMAQPFEVAKTILQVRNQDENAALASPIELETPKKRTSTYGSSIYEYQESDSDGDEPAYFTSNVPSTPTPSQPRRQNGRRSPSPVKKPVVPENYLTLRRPDSVLEVIGQLWGKEGAWGVWKGSNATFLYTVLQSLLENWSRSFLSAIFNVPDLGVKEDIDRLIDIASPYPWTSLFVAAAAAVVTGVALSPLDLVRTRLIVTPSAKGPRRTLATLRAMPSYLCNSMLAVPTVLNSLVHPVLTLSTPLVLRTRFMIDSHASPITFSVAKFFASSAAILIKLPVETVLRRGQVALLSTQEYVHALGGPEQPFTTIVPPGRYDGAFGTMFHIANEEGVRQVPGKTPVARKGKGRAKAIPTTVTMKGQGLDGLWRGWKVSWWGLVGLWTASVVGHGGEGEF
ncbi:mitochondrial carrier domain-containing protein [Dactylonectria estremocensis]|uniref:Mitochondrial carrier domain-containing protein n=1 Tax=Dactylonectria estremocensis TaxID=1079267 RepID=A0A9P9J5T0_9HYPO|nr:mitochondrial carrier domain-containing protein [Dactylonectria estremocensis]